MDTFDRSLISRIKKMMKDLLKNLSIACLAMMCFGVMISCGDDDSPGDPTPDPDPTFDPPTITVDPTTLETDQGETVSITVNMEADAGLSEVTVGTESIKTYDGTTNTDQLTYTFLAEEAGTVTLEFTVEDAQAATASASATITINEGIDLGFVVLDFAGASTGSEEFARESWDVRTIFDFAVTGSFVSSATVQSVNSQAAMAFAQDNPDSEDETKVLQIQKIPPEGFDNWGGWSHVIFNLGEALDASMVEALPQWDAENAQQTSGTKVFQVDAYYDDTIDPDFSFSDLTAITDVFNADPSQGYKVDLTLGKYDSIAFGGHDGDGYYIEYEAYITAPNEWQTLTFDVVGSGRTGAFFPTKETSVPAEEVDCIKFLPAGGYTGEDGNVVYFKNLRIIDAQ